MRLRLLPLISAGFLLAAVIPAHAAEFYFGAPSASVVVGAPLEVGVFLNTEGQRVNTMEATVTYPADKLTLSEVHTGGSAVNLWMTEPSLKDPGVVSFAGLTPGGIDAKNARLFSLIFTPKVTGTVSFGMKDETALLNDGEGTPATSVRGAPMTLEVVPASATPSIPGAGFSDWWVAIAAVLVGICVFVWRKRRKQK